MTLKKRVWQAADLYLHKSGFYVLSCQRDGGRGWIHAPPYLRLEISVSNEELGAAVLAAVNAAVDTDADTESLVERSFATTPWVSTTGASEWTSDHPLLGMAKVGSYDEFHKGLKATLHAWRSGREYRLTCLGSQPFGITFAEATDPTEEELGAKVREALAFEGKYLGRRRPGEGREPSHVQYVTPAGRILMPIWAPRLALLAILLGLTVLVVLGVLD